MRRATLERSIRFEAHHRYYIGDWSEEKNLEFFGELSRSHPHSYLITIWVEGPMDPQTGFSVDLAALDAALSKVSHQLASTDLNETLPPVRDSGSQPSCEVMAHWVYSFVSEQIVETVRQVRVAESDDLAAMYPATQL